MRVALIDLGTVMFKLLIADIHSKSRFEKVHSMKSPVRLGEKGINSNIIAPDAFERGLATLKNYVEAVQGYNCDRVVAYGTSALRSASNGREFVETIAQKHGLLVHIIDGQNEAELIYDGAKTSLDLGEEKSLILDIGGGSNEFIIANKHTIFWQQSYSLGASRLIEWLNPSDPITPSEIARLKNRLRTAMPDLFDACTSHGVSSLIGTSGSFEVLADMASILFRKQKPDTERTSAPIDLAEFKQLCNLILRATSAERKNMPGMHDVRVNLIVIAMVIIDLVVEECDIRKMTQSAYALNEGILFNIIEENL